MYAIEIVACKHQDTTQFPYADVRLSENLHDRMPVNGTARPYPHAGVCKNHKVRCTTDKTFGVTLDNTGENTCAIVLEEVSYLTGVGMIDIDLRVNRLGADPGLNGRILQLAREIRATKMRLNLRPELIHDQTITFNTHVTT